MRAPSPLTPLQVVATSPTSTPQALLVARALASALLLAHTILFSCTHHFDYAEFVVWANGALLLAFLFATFATLLELVSDHTHEPPVIAAELSTHSDAEATEETSTTVADNQDTTILTKTPLLHRLLPLFALPLVQAGGSAVLFATAAHYATGGALFRGQAVTTRYVDIILYIANPAIFLLDLVLGGRLSLRFRFRRVPLAWVFIGAYYAYAAIGNPALLPSGLKDICIVAGCGIGIPVLLVLLGRISGCVDATRMKKEAASSLGHDDARDGGRRETDPHEEEDTSDDASAKKKFPASPQPDRPTSAPLTSNADRKLGERKRSSTSSLTGAVERRFARVASMGSVSSTASSGRLSRVGSGRFPRIQSAGSASSVWSGINDVTVKIEAEMFCMPGVSVKEGVPLSRTASVTSTAL